MPPSTSLGTRVNVAPEAIPPSNLRLEILCPNWQSLPWIECLIDLSDGANGAARATGKTEPDIFRTGVFRDFLFEVRG